MKKTKPEKIFHIFDHTSLEAVVKAISSIKPSKDKVYRVRVTLDDEDRTLKQNKLAFLWHKARSGITGYTPEDDHRFCKLTYGIPILLADSEFYDFYNNTMLILSYEDKLKAMVFIPVTRLMSTKQFAEYLDTIDKESAIQGIQLPQPIDLYREAMMIQEDSKR